jgi:hypothetical protein
MDIEYLQKEIIPQRKKEIENGDNLATAQPIYVVMDCIEQVAFDHVETSKATTLSEKEPEEGYVDMNPEIETEDRVFCKSDEGMIIPSPITRFWVDRPRAFFLTSKAAHDYIKYQAHNLTDPYVYVFHSGYGNRQMDMLLKDEHSRIRG